MSPQPSPEEVVATVQTLLRTKSMLQWQPELDAFCAFIEANQVRSFLEVGTATGRLSLFLRERFKFDKVAACDLWQSPLLRGSGVEFYKGDHHDPSYLAWRERLGHFDLVFIDADHETGFRRDYEIELGFPHTFIGFHDIANTAYPALMRFWQDEVRGEKQTFANTDRAIRFGVPPVQFPFASWKTFDDYVTECGWACGIGVVRPEPAAR